MSSKRKPAVAGKPAVSAPPLPPGGEAEPARERDPESPAAVTRYDGQGGGSRLLRLVITAGIYLVAAVCAQLLLDAYFSYLDRSDEE